MLWWRTRIQELKYSFGLDNYKEAIQQIKLTKQSINGATTNILSLMEISISIDYEKY